MMGVCAKAGNSSCLEQGTALAWSIIKGDADSIAMLLCAGAGVGEHELKCAQHAAKERKLDRKVHKALDAVSKVGEGRGSDPAVV